MTYAIRTAASAVLMILLLLIFPVPVANAEPGLAFSVDKEVPEGESFEVRLVFTADDMIGRVETDLVYDSSAVEYIDGSATGGNGVLHLVFHPEEQIASISIPLTFKPLKLGSTEFAVNNPIIYDPDGAPSQISGISAQITIKEAGDPGEDSSEIDSSSVPDESSVPDDSSSAEITDPDSSSGSDKPAVSPKLGSIKLSEGVLTPGFDPDTFEYTINLSKSVTYVDIMPELSDIMNYIYFSCSSRFEGDVTVSKATLQIMGDETKVIIFVTDKEKEDDGPLMPVNDDHSNTYILNFKRSSIDDESSEAPLDSSSKPEKRDNSAVYDDSSRFSDETSKDESEAVSGVQELKSKLMPLLLTALGTLIIALAILFIWFKNRSTRKRHKIKSTSHKK